MKNWSIENRGDVDSLAEYFHGTIHESPLGGVTYRFPDWGLKTNFSNVLTLLAFSKGIPAKAGAVERIITENKSVLVDFHAEDEQYGVKS